MGKYSSLQSDIFSIFGTIGWKTEGVFTMPSNFVASDAGDEYIRVSIVANGDNKANPLNSVSGQLLIDIFTPAGFGPNRTNLIADKLDKYLAGKLIQTTSGGNTQLAGSTLALLGNDSANPSLYRSIYTIVFNYFGI